ncbi:MAG: DUF1415 family protein [Deltaproteobacteria bacterium]|nr:DUF1415 family protein [Deltaproteobacteria bacterium]
MIPDETLEDAARAVYARYAAEIVEAFDFCPWARRAREDDQVRIEVISEQTPTLAQTLAVSDQLAARDETAIGLLLFPRVQWSRGAWQRFVADLHTLDAASVRPLQKVFAAAAFHPSAEAVVEDPRRLVAFVRRTPDPTIQLVRHEVLQRVRSKDPPETLFVDAKQIETYLQNITVNPPARPIAERIAQANRATVVTQGVEHIEALLRDILRERNTRYQPHGVPERTV